MKNFLFISLMLFTVTAWGQFNTSDVLVGMNAPVNESLLDASVSGEFGYVINDDFVGYASYASTDDDWQGSLGADYNVYDNTFVGANFNFGETADESATEITLRARYLLNINRTFYAGPTLTLPYSFDDTEFGDVNLSLTLGMRLQR